MSVRLFLVRHGRVDFSSRDFADTPRGRQWDPPLDGVGRQQALRLAERLQHLEPASVVCVSPLRRCLETVAPFLRVTGMEARVDEDLAEVFTGEWEGVRFEDILSRDEDVARRFRQQEPLFSLAPGAESGRSLRARVVRAVEATLSGIATGSAVIVTHGGVINAYLGHVMGVPQDMFFLPDNASINTVRVDGTERRVWFLNDARHLVNPGLFLPQGQRDGTQARPGPP